MPSEAVTCRGKPYELTDHVYWHLVHPRSGFLLHNAANGQGLIVTISLVNQMEGLGTALSPYAWRAMHDEKEKVWERVRTEVNATLPRRGGALFLFENKEVAIDLAQEWFQDDKRHLVEARVVAGSILHRADARHLDALQPEWESAARSYWRGEMTADPVPEILVHGAAYFPGWAEPPFGLWQGIG